MSIAVVAVLFLVLLSHSSIPVQGSRFPFVKRGPLPWKRRIFRFAARTEEKQIYRPPPFPPSTAGIVLFYSVIASELSWRVADGVGLTTAHVLMATNCAIALLHTQSVISLEPWVFFYDAPLPRTYIMAAFAHKDVNHLISNVYSLSSYGVTLSQRMGNRRVAYLYMIGTWVSKLIARRVFDPMFRTYRESAALFLRDLFTMLLKPFGLGATLLNTLPTRHRPTASLGASGAISGLEAYWRLSAPRDKLRLVFSRIAWLDVLLHTCIEGLKGLMGRTNINHASHLGGTCVGVCLFYCEKICKNLPKWTKERVRKQQQAATKGQQTITPERKIWTWGSISSGCRNLCVGTIKRVDALLSRGPLSTIFLLWGVFYQ